MSKSGFKKFVDGKGFYVALAVCLVGAGAATWAAVRSTLQNVTVLDNSPSFTVGEEQEETVQDFPQNIQKEIEYGNSAAVPDLETYSEEKSDELSLSENSSQDSTITVDTEETQEVLVSQDEPLNLEYILPISGSILNNYSNGELVKSKTLRDWRTHDGVDIKATIGTPVAAAADGVVEEIYKDGLWGTVIKLRHDDGAYTVYSSLGEEPTVQIGDDVEQGDIIGAVGDTADAEIALDSHLHFEMIKDGEYVDPLMAISGDNTDE